MSDCPLQAAKWRAPNCWSGAPQGNSELRASGPRSFEAYQDAAAVSWSRALCCTRLWSFRAGGRDSGSVSRLPLVLRQLPPGCAWLATPVWLRSSGRGGQRTQRVDCVPISVLQGAQPGERPGIYDRLALWFPIDIRENSSPYPVHSAAHSPSKGSLPPVTRPWINAWP